MYFRNSIHIEEDFINLANNASLISNNRYLSWDLEKGLKVKDIGSFRIHGVPIGVNRDSLRLKEALMLAGLPITSQSLNQLLIHLESKFGLSS
jgi:hypothetical protein